MPEAFGTPTSNVRGVTPTSRRPSELPMFLRHPATALIGLALALAGGPQPAPMPRASAEPGKTAAPAPADPARESDRLSRALRAAQGGDLEEAARLIEEVLAAE